MATKIDCSILRNRLAKIEIDISNLSFYHDVGPDGAEWWCNEEFSKLLNSGKLEDMMIYLGTSFAEGNDLKMNRGDPLFGRCKPIKPMKVGVFSDHVRLYVIGQHSDRIKDKWERRYSEIIGVPVVLEWEHVMPDYQVAESYQGGEDDD